MMHSLLITERPSTGLERFSAVQLQTVLKLRRAAIDEEISRRENVEPLRCPCRFHCCEDLSNLPDTEIDHHENQRYVYLSAKKTEYAFHYGIIADACCPHCSGKYLKFIWSCRNYILGFRLILQAIYTIALVLFVADFEIETRANHSFESLENADRVFLGIVRIGILCSDLLFAFMFPILNRDLFWKVLSSFEFYLYTYPFFAGWICLAIADWETAKHWDQWMGTFFSLYFYLFLILSDALPVIGSSYKYVRFKQWFILIELYGMTLYVASTYAFENDPLIVELPLVKHPVDLRSVGHSYIWQQLVVRARICHVYVLHPRQSLFVKTKMVHNSLLDKYRSKEDLDGFSLPQLELVKTFTRGQLEREIDLREQMANYREPIELCCRDFGQIPQIDYDNYYHQRYLHIVSDQTERFVHYSIFADFCCPCCAKRYAKMIWSLRNCILLFRIFYFVIGFFSPIIGYILYTVSNLSLLLFFPLLQTNFVAKIVTTFDFYIFLYPLAGNWFATLYISNLDSPFYIFAECVMFIFTLLTDALPQIGSNFDYIVFKQRFLIVRAISMSWWCIFNHHTKALYSPDIKWIGRVSKSLFNLLAYL